MLLNSQIGEAVGELYVAKYFPPENKAKMDQLVANLRTAMGERLKTLSWMDEKTRAEAEKKLTTFDPRIGYPVKWRDYSALTIEPGKIFEDVRNARKFEWNRQVARLNQPVDRTEWGMTPQTVNAYYDPSMNQITFPAAILQPPFFDPNADPAVNYGAIGAVIGHEMGHGFDDQGREYDETGKIRNWWTPETNKKFLAQTERFAAQYNAFCPLEGVCVNGKLTMGENIGDLGGLEMAYTAYKLSLNGKEAPVIDGFTGDQRFFMAHAQVWRGIERDDALRNLVLTNPHSPEAARGSIPERNMDSWYAAFNVKNGDKLFIKPEDRVKIW
jgi:predicted metalloendopeptidase